MSQLTSCQPGWFAVFENPDGDGFSTEPIACWIVASDDEDVRPICALGGDVCDASQAKNYLGVVGPGSGNATKLYETIKALAAKAP